MGVFEDKTVIVTGGGKEKSIGYGVARAFAREGANVMMTGASKAKLREARELEKEFGVRVLTHCLSEPSARDIEAAVASAAREFGRVDALVCCLQAAKCGDPVEKTNDADFEACLEWGAGACLRWMRACHPHLRETSGSVINFVSGAALAGQAGLANLAATSGAIQAMSAVAAGEWAADGINVNTVCAFAQTAQFEHWVGQFPGEAEAMRLQKPSPTLADTEQEVGATCVFLASDAARSITGQTIRIGDAMRKIL